MGFHRTSPGHPFAYTTAYNGGGVFGAPVGETSGGGDGEIVNGGRG